ncbi:hypothetical protein BRADI_3g14033v3, partial [Brachypodium distachyon]
MELALVSAATGALKPVLGKLATLMGDEYKRFKRVRREIGFLTRELTTMEVFLLKMSMEEDPDDQAKLWMNEVRDLSYDIEDKLDDFMVHVGDRSAKPNGFMEKIKNLMDKTKARRQIAKTIEDLKKQVNEVSERHARYKADEAISNATNATIDPRALAIFEDVCESRQQQPKLISIVGYGGLGKTTLANRISQELIGQFDCHAFVSVSRNPDVVKILNTILHQVKKDYSSSMEDIPTLITEISIFLVNKRYFIVVDDIWNVEIWDVIKLVFPRIGCGGRIITTTRSNVVAQSCSSLFNGRTYSMEPLSVVHSRQLFQKRIFNSEECPSHLEEVSGQILKKCAGLPLAIIAISGLLASKAKTEDQWCRVETSIGHALERNPIIEGMIKIISLSYFDLPHHLKTCLLSLSIFPEDTIIIMDLLIRMWIAEGFIPSKDGYTLYEAGEMCFNELVNRSLIKLTMEEEDYYGWIARCRVHDVILDFVISKAIEENYVTIIGVPGVHYDPQNKFKHLRVLCFEGCGQLEDHHLADIDNLLHLECLSLSDADTVKVLGDVHLQELCLGGSSISTVPRWMGSLVNLHKLEDSLINVTQEDVKILGGLLDLRYIEV